MGHTDDVLCLCQHPENKGLFASGQIGKEPLIAIWDCETCETKSILQNGHDRGVSAVDFSHDGSLLVSIGLDDYNTMCVWDWPKGRIVATNRTHGDKVLDVKFDPFKNNNSRIITCGVKHIKFWTLSGNTLSSKNGIMGKSGPPQTFLTLAFDRHSNVLVGALNGNIYQFEDNKVLKVHNVHKGAIYCLGVGGDDADSCFVTGGKDGFVRILDKHLQIVQQFNLAETEQGYAGIHVKSVNWKQDKILVGTLNSEIFELNVKNVEKVRLLVQGHSEGELWALATHPSKANAFTTSSDDCTIQQWNISERGVIGKKVLEKKARSLCYSPDGSQLAVGFIDGSFAIYKSKDLSETYNCQIRKEVIHELKFSPDGLYLAVGSNDNFVDIVACSQNWKKVGVCSGSSSFITHLDWSKDSKYLQTNSGAAERLVFKMPAGKRVTSKDEIDKIVWQTWTGVLGAEVAGIWAKYTDTNDVNAIDVNFDQGVCVTGDDFGLVKLFKYPTFKKGAKFKKYGGHSAHVTNVRFTSDKKRVITVGGADHAVFQWRFVSSGSEDKSPKRINNKISQKDDNDSDIEASDSELSNGAGFDSDIEREAEQNYDRCRSKEYANDLFKNIKNDDIKSEQKSSSAKQKQAPESGLVIDFVFGYRGYDCHNNIYMLSSGEIVYHVAALGIVYDKKMNSQKCYTGHSDDILCLTLHPSKDIAATGQVGKSATIHIWDCVTLKCVSLLRGDMMRGICALDFSSHDGGKKLAAVSLDENHTIHIWDWKKGEKVASVRGHKDKIFAIKCNPFNSDKFLIVGIKHIKFLTQAGGSLTTKRGTFGTVAKLVTMCCATYGKSEDLCFTGAESGFVYCWKDAVLTRVVEAHKNGPCFCISAVSNFEGFVSGGKDGCVCLWDDSFEKTLKSYSVEPSDDLLLTTSGGSSKTISLRAVRIGHGVIVAGTKNGEIMEIDKSGSVTILVQGHQEGEIWGLAVCNSGLLDRIATVSDDKTLKMWSLSKKKMLANFNLKKAARCVDYSPNGHFLAVGFYNGSFAVYKDPIDGKESVTTELDKVVEIHHRKEEISDIKFSPESAKYLAVASHDNFVDIYNVNSEKRVGVCKGASSYITHIDWDSKENLLMVNSGAKEVLFFEAPRGKRVSLRNDLIESTKWFTMTCVVGPCVDAIWPPRCDVTDINACSRNCDSTLIATGDDFGFVKLFNFPAKGKFGKFKQYCGHSAHVTNVRWTSDGSKLISTGGADTSIIVWRNKSFMKMTSVSDSVDSEDLSSARSNFNNEEHQQSGDSEVSFGDSDEEGYDSDVMRECSIDYKSKIYSTSLSVARNKKPQDDCSNTSRKNNDLTEAPAISRTVQSKASSIVASNVKNEKESKSKGSASGTDIVGLQLKHIIGYRGFDTRNNLHFSPGEGKDIVYTAAAVCIVQNIASGTQQFYTEHTDDVLCLAICQFPKLSTVCASGQVGNNPAVHIWDCATLQTLAILNNNHTDGVCHLNFSSSGRLLCTVGLDESHTLIVWKWQEALRLSSVQLGPNRIFVTQFRPDSDSKLVSVGVKYITFWTLAGSTLIEKKAHIPKLMKNHKKQTMLSVAFSPDDVTFTGTMSGDIYVWKGNVLQRVINKAHKGPVFTMFTTLKDGLIVSAGKDKNIKESPSAVKLWDSEMKRCKSFYIEGASKQLTVRSVCRANNRILVGSRDSDVIIVEEKKGTCVKLIDGHSEGELCGLSTHPTDENVFVSTSEDNTLRLWDLKSLKDPTKLQLGKPSKCVSFSPDGESIAVGFKNGSFSVYSTITMQLWAQKRDRSGTILVIRFSPDGSKLVVGSQDGVVDIYDFSAGPTLPRINYLKGEAIGSHIISVDFSADGCHLRVVSGDYTISVFDVVTGKKIESTEQILWHSWTSTVGEEVDGIWRDLESSTSEVNANIGKLGDLINSAHVNPRKVNRIATGDDCGCVKLFTFPCCKSGNEDEDDDKSETNGSSTGLIGQYLGHSADVTSLRFTSNDSHLISAGGEDSCLFIWKCLNR